MEIPNWEDINVITSDLRSVLDSVGRNEMDSIPGIRARLARAIAKIRDDKILLERSIYNEKPPLMNDQVVLELDFPVPFMSA